MWFTFPVLEDTTMRTEPGPDRPGVATTSEPETENDAPSIVVVKKLVLGAGPVGPFGLLELPQAVPNAAPSATTVGAVEGAWLVL